MAVYRLKTEKPLNEAEGPHLHSPLSVSKIAWSKALALLPLWFASIFCFGIRVLLLTAIVYGSSSFMEWLYVKTVAAEEKIRKGEILFESLLLVLLLAPAVPWWAALFAACAAAVVGKALLGGRVEHIFHPALVAVAATSA